MTRNPTRISKIHVAMLLRSTRSTGRVHTCTSVATHRSARLTCARRTVPGRPSGRGRATAYLVGRRAALALPARQARQRDHDSCERRAGASVCARRWTRVARFSEVYTFQLGFRKRLTQPSAALARRQLLRSMRRQSVRSEERAEDGRRDHRGTPTQSPAQGVLELATTRAPCRHR